MAEVQVMDVDQEIKVKKEVDEVPTRIEVSSKMTRKSSSSFHMESENKLRQ